MDAATDVQMLTPDVIVVDPPRKGCDTKCLETIVQMSPKRVVYVSCDSATLARDLKFLCENGYEVKRVRGCDMFGQTVSVETVVKLSLKKDTPKIEVTMGPDKKTVEKCDRQCPHPPPASLLRFSDECNP